MNRLSTVECIAEPQREVDFDDPTFSLGMQDVGGIFILHFGLALAALGVAATQFFYTRGGNSAAKEQVEVAQESEPAQE